MNLLLVTYQRLWKDSLLRQGLGGAQDEIQCWLAWPAPRRQGVLQTRLLG